MVNDVRFYDRALSRLSRRELLNVAWKLGIAAVMSPLASSKLWAQPAFKSYPFTLGVTAETRCAAHVGLDERGPCRGQLEEAKCVAGWCRVEDHMIEFTSGLRIAEQL